MTNGPRSCLRARAAVRFQDVLREDVVFPWLNILTTGRPNAVLEAFACWSVRPGVYTSASGLRLRIIVISELSRDRETLLLRLFGRGQVFVDALFDLDELPSDAWERNVITPLLKDIKADASDDAETNSEDDMTRAEQIRMLAEVIRKGEIREAKREAKQEGKREGKREGEEAMLLRQLQVRFGELPPSVETRVHQASEEELHLWAERILRARKLNAVFKPQSSGSSRKTTPSAA